ncbi:MAG TPA: hypothetical protein VKQ72_19775, partial [Aggregatilineales bacterium]|nr:hypothetical protein [Aggregatilineales bacterium]
MNTNRNSVRQFIAIVSISFIVMAITACQPSAPITIFVTATPAGVVPTQAPAVQATGGSGLSANATATSGNFGPVVAPDLTPLPTFTQRPPKTPTSIPVTPGGPTSQYGPVVSHNYPATSTPLPAPGTSPTVAATTAPVSASSSGPTPNYGAVVGPNYTPPPTQTPVPPAAVTPANVTLPPPVTPGPSPTPGPILRADLMGIQIHPFLTNNQWNTMLALSHQLGVGWIKIQVLWSDLQPTQPSAGNDGFSTDFNTLIQDLQRAHKSNLRTLVSIAGAPDWSRPADARGKENGPPANPQDLATFIARLIHDTKPVNIDAIEVWNEPNLIREWHGKPISGAQYMSYFNAVYPAIINEEKA